MIARHANPWTTREDFEAQSSQRIPGGDERSIGVVVRIFKHIHVDTPIGLSPLLHLVLHV